MLRAIRMKEKKSLKKMTSNIFTPYTRSEMIAVSFFVNHEGEHYGRGSFNLDLYRKFVEIQKS